MLAQLDGIARGLSAGGAEKDTLPRPRNTPRGHPLAALSHGHAGRLLGSEQVREEEGMKAAPPPAPPARTGLGRRNCCGAEGLEGRAGRPRATVGTGTSAGAGQTQAQRKPRALGRGSLDSGPERPTPASRQGRAQGEV